MRGWAVPLAEMAFWEGRHEVLGALYEQLDTPGARAAVALVRARTTDRNMLAAFHAQHGDLLRVRAPARLFWLVRVRPAAEGPVDHGPGAERRCMNIGCGIDGTEPGRGATQRYNSCVLLCAPVHAIPIIACSAIMQCVHNGPQLARELTEAGWHQDQGLHNLISIKTPSHS